jgi:RimJ/RimL family protein N-acetyltransferase
MKIIECQNVDLISPFPMQEIERVKGWIHCYHSFIVDDTTPAGDDKFVMELLKTELSAPFTSSWAVIDKFNVTNSHHEVPLVGFLQCQLFSPYNGYMHVMSSRSCWGKGLMDEAFNKVIDGLFSENPQICRLSMVIFDKSRPAKSFAFRHGFKLEGKFDDFTRKDGKPIRVVHLGLLRRDWEAAQIVQPLPEVIESAEIPVEVPIPVQE